MCELLLKNLADGEKSQKTPGRGGGGKNCSTLFALVTFVVMSTVEVGMLWSNEVN